MLGGAKAVPRNLPIYLLIGGMGHALINNHFIIAKKLAVLYSLGQHFSFILTKRNVFSRGKEKVVFFKKKEFFLKKLGNKKYLCLSLPC